MTANNTVKNIAEAWARADEIISTDYMYDAFRSERAGYAVYYSTMAGCDEYICDLGDRLEVNLKDGSSVNIWIKPEPEIAEWMIADALSVINDAVYDLEDKVHPRVADATSIGKARELLYGAYAELKKLLDENHPDSKLYKQYNLYEA